MDDNQERIVAQGLRDGKTEAWQALYEAYAERVWHVVARLLGAGAADVADVVQETMLAAARSAATFDPLRGSLWFWLWGIARHQVALHFRHQERQHRLKHAGQWLADGDGHLLRWLDGQAPSPPAALAAAELAILVRATLTQLPDDYAMLLTAKYMNDDSMATIALREHASETAVRSKLARARQAFRQAFRHYADCAPAPVNPAESA